MVRPLTAVLTGMLIGAAAPAVAETPAAPDVGSRGAVPVQMVRTLQLMQDQIAIGSVEAHVGQRSLLAVMDNRLMELPTALWRDSKNVRAAAVFVLSGGNPRILRKILSLGAAEIPREDSSLVEGALAYVEGREEEARNLLLPVDPETLPPSLGSQIALVQAALVVRSNPAKSLALLDYVRLQAPGTLLEEAALRRQVFVASQIDDAKKFEALVTQYLRRFRHSVYAGNFRQRLASALMRIDFGRDPARFGRIATILGELEPEVRRDLYLLIARASVELGLVKSAVLAADKALELSDGDPNSAARARLYRAAAMVVTPDTIDKSLQILKSIDRAPLEPADLALLDAAVSMADQIRKVPETNASRERVAAPPAAPEKGAQAPEQLSALSKARDALKRVDSLIKN